MRRKNVRPQIVHSQRIDRCVSSVRVEMSGFDQRNLLPRGNARRSHVAPGFTAVGCKMNQTVVGPTPDPVRVERGRRNAVNHAAAMRLLRRILLVFSNARRQLVIRS